MGILDRVKNMFTEEVEEPVVPKEKEVEQTVTREEPVISTDEKPVIKKEEKMMPIFFDDQDFATLDRPVEEKKVASTEKYYTKKTETPEKKVFKLSPVISPVYGVLDKNYHKEDITPKRSTPKVTYYERESITIDEVRNKAYGDVEEKAEVSFESRNDEPEEIIGSRMQRKYRSDMMFEDLMDPNYEPIEDKEESKTIEPVSLDDFLVSNDLDIEEDFKDPNEDTLTESDLFHLIDSMYDKEDE